MFRFDGSDLMPGAVGAGTFWKRDGRVGGRQPGHPDTRSTTSRPAGRAELTEPVRRRWHRLQGAGCRRRPHLVRRLHRRVSLRGALGERRRPRPPVGAIMLADPESLAVRRRRHRRVRARARLPRTGSPAGSASHGGNELPWRSSSAPASSCSSRPGLSRRCMNFRYSLQRPQRRVVRLRQLRDIFTRRGQHQGADQHLWWVRDRPCAEHRDRPASSPCSPTSAAVSRSPRRSSSCRRRSRSSARAIIWNFVYSPKEYGLLNSLLQLLPGEQETQFFLQDSIFGIAEQ